MSAANGESSASLNKMSAAQRLLQEHTTEAEATVSSTSDHRPTVEEVEDEEDINHPPPSANLKTQNNDAFQANAAIPMASSAAMSEKAAGKQKLQPQPQAQQRKPFDGKARTSEIKQPVLNTQSEDMFPALSTPKSTNTNMSASAWGRKPTAVATNGSSNLISPMQSPPAGRQTSTGTSSPLSGAATPNSSIPSSMAMGRGSIPSAVSLPGRYTERIQFAPSQLIPRQQLKKPVPDVLRDINRRSKAKVESRPGPGGVLVFEGQGPVDAVRQALKEVANQLGSKQSVQVPIPASVRAQVIGRQGATIQGISKRTGARIQVPKTEDMMSPEDEDSATIDVTIEGDAVAAELARREIEAIVNERTSSVNMRLKDIPAEYYPFLTGNRILQSRNPESGQDLRVQIPQYHTWRTQAPPQLSRESLCLFVPQPDIPIHISGDRQAAQEARAEVERQVELLRRQLTSDQLPVERGRHQFIVGDKGASLDDFLAETGCSVILPPKDDESEMITVVGPADKIDNGLNKIMDLASSMSMASVDVSRQHVSAPLGPHTHARNLTRYLRQRNALEELEKAYNASIILPISADGPAAWEIYSRDGKEAMRLRADIMNIISGLPPSRLRSMSVDPFFHDHIRYQEAPRLRNECGVYLVFPEAHHHPSDLLLIYESPGNPSDHQLPRKQPSTAEIRDFERYLKQAQERIDKIVAGHGSISSRDLEAPPKLHEKIRRYVGREQQSIPDDRIPIQLLDPYHHPNHKFEEPPKVSKMPMRGPSSELDDFVAKIAKFVEQEKRDEIERGYTINFDFPQKHANVLIGRKGDNIRKLKEEFDVDIQVNDGNVELKGPKAKADAAKAHIVSLGKRLDDEVTHVVKVKPQYHGDLIGSKGTQVRRLQDRYNVRINFPKALNEDTTDLVNENGGISHRGSRSSAADEVTVRGSKRGADEAREELLNLLQWTIDNSHTATISIAQEHLPYLIGHGGREMDKLRVATGAQVDVPGLKDVQGVSGRAEIKIRGTKKQVEEAKKILEAKAKKLDNTITKTVDVPKRHHKSLIGPGGSNIRNITMKAGGSDDRQSRTVRFPSQESQDSAIVIEGDRDVVEKICSSIDAFVKKLDNQVTEAIEIPQSKHSKLIGRGGEVRRNLESEFDITLDIPRKDTPGPSGSSVKLSGTRENIEKAKTHLLRLIAENEGETIQVPRRLHHAASEGGQFFRRLRNEYNVTVDHAGQRPPAQSATAASQTRNRVNASGSASLPLITDDLYSENNSDNLDHHSWEIFVNANDDNKADENATIPWVMHGSVESVKQARALLERTVADAARQTTTGYLILPDPRTYRFVVGQGGTQVNTIREKTRTRVTVPKSQTQGEAIEIRGEREGVEQAKEMILGVVRDAGGNSQGRRGGRG